MIEKNGNMEFWLNAYQFGPRRLILWRAIYNSSHNTEYLLKNTHFELLRI